jgi:hypothetical protein
MPPRTTRKSYRPRVSDRTMVDTLNRTACPRQKPKASSHRQHESAEKEKLKPRSIAWAEWQKEILRPLQPWAKCFFLTSPFIERANRTSRGIIVRNLIVRLVDMFEAQPCYFTSRARLARCLRFEIDFSRRTQ